MADIDAALDGAQEALENVLLASLGYLAGTAVGPHLSDLVPGVLV